MRTATPKVGVPFLYADCARRASRESAYPDPARSCASPDRDVLPGPVAPARRRPAPQV